MSSLLRRLLLGAACASLAASPATAEDWSGWWGGLSVGGAYTHFDGSRISDGSEFCIAETSPGASAGCEFGPSFARTYTQHELNGSSFNAGQTYDAGSVDQPSVDFSDVQPPNTGFTGQAANSYFPDTTFLVTRSNLTSPTTSQDALVVGALNAFDFGAYQT